MGKRGELVKNEWEKSVMIVMCMTRLHSSASCHNRIGTSSKLTRSASISICGSPISGYGIDSEARFSTACCSISERWSKELEGVVVVGGVLVPGCGVGAGVWVCVGGTGA